MALIEINKETDFYKEIKDVEGITKKNSYSYFSNFFKRRNVLQFQKNIELLQTLEQSTDYINTQFKSSGNPPIELYIVPVIDEGKPSKSKTKDEGAVFYAPGPKEYIVDPRILISQNYSLGLDKGKTVAQNMIDSLGQEDFAKTIFYHETGHYLDYLLSHGLLRDVAQNQNLLSTSFLNRSDPLYQDFLNSWQFRLHKDKEENDIEELFKTMLRESAADCWACVSLFQEKMLNNSVNNNQKDNNSKKTNKLFKAIISATIQARKLSHNNTPEEEYATYNALTRLYYNYKKHKPQNNQDWVNIVQKSIQQGLVLNLQEIIGIKYNNHRKITTKIIEYKDKASTSLGFQQQRNNMINKLKSYKITRRNPDKFIV